MSYETHKEIIKLQNLIDEKIMLSPEHMHQFKSEIDNLKNEISKLTKSIFLAFTIFSLIQFSLFLYLLKK